MAGNFVKLVEILLIVEYIFGTYMRVKGVWSTWEPWSHCSCSTGTKTRDRVCTSAAISPCLGSSHQTEPCRSHCHGAVNGGWSMWESWSQCFCDTGTQTRQRECNNPAPTSGGSDCVGLRSEQTSCADQCPVNGNWSTWGTWSNCMCNTGTHNRTRECNNPLPTRGGDDCVGAQYEQASCADQCPGKWIDWGPWSPCTVTCNGGYQLRQRQCTKLDNTLSQDCHGDPSQVQICGTMNCQGQWATWNMWSDCTTTCGEGTQIRVRHCLFSDNITIANNCPGESIDTESCRNLPCSVTTSVQSFILTTTPSTTTTEVTTSVQSTILTTTPSTTTTEGPGVWVEWTQWSACSASCGSGFRYIARFCINPHTEKEKHDCLGHAVESQSCQVKQCSEATTTATTKTHVPLFPPEIFGSTEANVGGNVTLLCLTGIPGLTLTWYYQENHPLPVRASQPMGTNELIITGVDSKNYGNYTCELSDSYHTVTTRVLINLRETSPVILSLIISSDTIVEGAPVKIICNVLAFPEPVIRWGYKDRSGNSFVPPPVSYKEGGKEIDIDSFQSNLYGGTWTCSAINKLGSDHRDISL